MLPNLAVVSAICLTIAMSLQTATNSGFAPISPGQSPVLPTIVIASSEMKKSEAVAEGKESVKYSNPNLVSEQPADNSGESEQSPRGSQEGVDRVLQARLKGSLCPSCLIKLEEKLRTVDGVKRARVIRPAKNGGPVVNEPRYAQVEIMYSSAKQNPKSLKKFVRQNDFDLRNERDLELKSDYQPIPEPI